MGTEEHLVGDLLLSEIRLLEQLRKASDAALREVGGLEFRKHHLLQQVAAYEARAQTVLQEAAARLGIPEGETWKVTPDGKVFRG